MNFNTYGMMLPILYESVLASAILYAQNPEIDNHAYLWPSDFITLYCCFNFGIFDFLILH